MICSRINMKLAENFSPQAIVSNHPFDGVLDQKCGLLAPNVPHRVRVVTADKARIPHVRLGHLFLSSKDGPPRVDHDDMIAGVDMRRIIGLVLAAKQNCRALRNPTYRLACCVNDIPGTPNLGWFRAKSFHGRADIKEAPNACQDCRANSSSSPGLPRKVRLGKRRPRDAQRRTSTRRPCALVKACRGRAAQSCPTPPLFSTRLALLRRRPFQGMTLSARRYPCRSCEGHKPCRCLGYGCTASP